MLTPAPPVAHWQQLVVLTGLPASGKTTLGQAIAHRIQAPFVDKDSFLERLFETRGIGDAAHRRALSAEADEHFRAAVAKLPLAVVTSWWRHPASPTPSGTVAWWLGAPNIHGVEVHCRCRPETAADRFLRRSRHPGHLDRRWGADDLLRLLADQAALGPLSAQAIDVPTEQAVAGQALEELLGVITRRLGAGSQA